MKRRFRNNLKEMRNLNQMTQSEVSEMIGVTLNTYQNYENGFTLPRVDTAINLADTLICEVEDIWGLELELKAQDYRKNMKYKKELEAQGKTPDEEDIKLWREFREDEGYNLTLKEATDKHRFELFPNEHDLAKLAKSWGLSSDDLENGEDIIILTQGIIIQNY